MDSSDLVGPVIKAPQLIFKANKYLDAHPGKLRQPVGSELHLGGVPIFLAANQSI